MQPVRSMLFTPGNRLDMLAKAVNSGTDAVIVDLEDSVSIDNKPEARDNLQQLPDSPVPYYVRSNAVETGLLIDILDAVGLSAIGPVDLERRIHRNQPLGNLSQMSYVILQGAIRKLEERHRIELLTEVGRGMKLINTGKDHFNLEVREIGDEIRPPISSVPAYVERRKSLKDR